jgi:SPP1 family predicted phage head-tail adaptor
MRAGLLRHRVSLQASAETRGSDGEITRTWVTVTTVWASVAPTGGKEYVSEDMLKAAASHLITTRYRPGLDTSMRVLFGTRVFNIESIVNKDERDRELVLVCQEAL